MNKRVKYNRCPLVEVIFQLRFPTILSINSKQPADFQEKIRKEYPFYDEGIEEQNELLMCKLKRWELTGARGNRRAE